MNQETSNVNWEALAKSRLEEIMALTATVESKRELIASLVNKMLSDEPKTLSAERGGCSVQRPCSAENFRLSNETKIKAITLFHAMQNHIWRCLQCCEYLYDGDGDLCSHGKEIIARELAYAETTPEFPPNDPSSPTGRE